MPATIPTDCVRTLTYRRQRVKGGTDRAFIELNGTRRYLGAWNTAESKTEYRRVVAEWLASGGVPAVSPQEITVAEVCVAFLKHADKHYRRADGTVTSECSNFALAIKPLDELYGDQPAATFGPKALRAVAGAMIRSGWARTTINSQVRRVRHIFKWAAGHELIPASVWHGLAAVEGLKRGRCDARESAPVKPVPEAWIDAVRPYLSRQVEALIDLQLLTGARAGELVLMRGIDLDTSANVWTYTPAHHKNAHHEHKRSIFIGPKAQEIVAKFLRSDTSAYLFSPKDADAERRVEEHEARETPMSCGNKPGTNRRRKPETAPGDHYTTTTYRRCIARACEQAFPPAGELGRRRVPANGRKAKSTRWETNKEYHARLGDKGIEALAQWRAAHSWHPHQLRHNAATRIRRAHGIDMAQTILGHRLGSAITEIYAEANVEKVKAIMAKAG